MIRWSGSSGFPVPLVLGDFSVFVGCQALRALSGGEVEAALGGRGRRKPTKTRKSVKTKGKTGKSKHPNKKINEIKVPNGFRMGSIEKH